MKRKFRPDSATVLWIAGAACAVIFALGVLIYGISTGFGIDDLKHFGVQGEMNVPQTTYEDLDELTELEIDWRAGPVTVVFYGGGTLEVTETAQRALTAHEKLDLDISGTKLEISWDDALFHLPFSHAQAKALEVRIPAMFRETMESVEIRNDAGDIRMEEMTAGKLLLKTTSGEIELGSAAAETAEISTDSGDITAQSMAVGERLDVSTVSGRVEITGCDAGKLSVSSTTGDVFCGGAARDLRVSGVSANAEIVLTALPGRADVRSVSGPVRIALPDSPEGFSCAFSSVGGAFASDFAVREAEGLYTAGDGAAELLVKTTSADCEIVKTRAVAP